MKKRVLGQDHVIDDMVRLIRLQWGKIKRHKPIANLLFLGPTGTGKTELSKALTVALFKDERTMLRFDCGELKTPEAVTRLIGVPTGYMGADKGGQLTRPMLAGQPERLILFDEIEKADLSISDIFLGMLGEGRLTEQSSGKTADFTNSIVILTSNAESDEIGQIQERETDYHRMVNAVKTHLANAGVFRPEIIGRIDRVYVFKPLDNYAKIDVVLIKIKALAEAYGLELANVDPHLISNIIIQSQKLEAFGMRELERVLEDEFAEGMLEAAEAGGSRINIEQVEGGQRITPA